MHIFGYSLTHLIRVHSLNSGRDNIASFTERRNMKKDQVKCAPASSNFCLVLHSYRVRYPFRTRRLFFQLCVKNKLKSAWREKCLQADWQRKSITAGSHPPWAKRCPEWNWKRSAPLESHDQQNNPQWLLKMGLLIPTKTYLTTFFWLWLKIG